MTRPAEPRSEAPPRVEFLLSASPNDAFYSQLAFFRLSLDSLGAAGRAARVVAVFGDEEHRPLPVRWAPYFRHIEVHHAPLEQFLRRRFYAASDLRFELVDPRARISCMCDADTAFLRTLPESFFEAIGREPAICGVVAHYPLPPSNFRWRRGMLPWTAPARAWNRLAGEILGRPLPRLYRYTLVEGGDDVRSPFCVNHGFLAGPPALLQRLHGAMIELQPRVAEFVGDEFSGQAAIALAVEKARLPHRALPMRFNFPNDRDADRLHREELENAILIHYLRTTVFHRNRIFAEQPAFEDFLALDLVGSDRVFRDHVMTLTEGKYPFRS